MGRIPRPAARYIGALISRLKSLLVVLVRSSNSLPDFHFPFQSLHLISILRSAPASRSPHTLLATWLIREFKCYSSETGEFGQGDSKHSIDQLDLMGRPTRKLNTPLSPHALVDIRKKARGSGAGGLVICMSSHSFPFCASHLSMSQLTPTTPVSCSDPRVVPEQYFGLNRGG